MDITISPPESRLKPFAYDYIYHPWGILLEYPLSPARKLGSVGTTEKKFYHIGEYSVMHMLSTEDNCGPNGTSLCSFDTRLGYDLMQSNPHKYASNITWGNVFQDQMAWEIFRTNLKSIADIKSVNINRYWVLIDAIFIETYFKPVTAALAVLAFQPHPITHSLWALRQNRLVEISKSGVQVQLPNGKCLPIGLGLCQECNWAPSGLPCRPCSNIDKTSPIWWAKCDNQKCGSFTSSSRRLLSNEMLVDIHFVLCGNITTIKAAWPNSTGNYNECNITVSTSDPIGEMKLIREKLMAMQDVQVLTQPHVVVLLHSIPRILKPPGSSNNNNHNGSNSNNKQRDETSSDSPNIAIILIISLMLVVIVIIVIIFLIHKCKHNNTMPQKKKENAYHHF
jgi:hypothetical protein